MEANDNAYITYRKTNILFVLFALIGIISLFMYKQVGGELYCQVKTATGLPCNSCGITRDFISFLNFDFKNSKNPNSLKMFGFILIQAIYRVAIVTKLLKLKTVNIKKTISLDIMLSTILATAILFQFW